MQEYVEKNNHCNALPEELFKDLTERLKSGTLRTKIKLQKQNGDATLEGDLTGLNRFVYGGREYDVLFLTVAEPANKKRYSTVAPIQTRKVDRPCPLEAVARIQICYGKNPKEFADVYSRA